LFLNLSDFYPNNSF